jgi:hypothetical protein
VCEGFTKSLVHAPFRILTAEEEKTFSKHYKSISQQIKDALTTAWNSTHLNARACSTCH